MDWLLCARLPQSSHVYVVLVVCVWVCGSTPQHRLHYHVLLLDATGTTDSRPGGHPCVVSDTLWGDTISPGGDARLQVKATAKTRPQVS